MKPLSYCYTNKPFQQFQQWPWHEAAAGSSSSAKNSSDFETFENKSSFIWGNKSIWNSPITESTSQNFEKNSQINQQPEPLSNLNGLWYSPNIADNDESLGSIWNIPNQSVMARKTEVDLEAPLPPSMYTKENNFSFIRPSEIEGNEWNSSNRSQAFDPSRNEKSKEVSVRSPWSNGTPNALQHQQQQQHQQQSGGEFRAHNKVITNNSHKFSTLNNMSETQNFRNKNSSIATNSVNTQLFSEEFLSYLSMIH